MFAPVGRERDGDSLENLPDLAGNVGAGGDALAVLFDGGLLQAVEIADQVTPFDDDAGSAATVRQFLLEHQGEKEQKTWPRIAASQEW